MSTTIDLPYRGETLKSVQRLLAQRKRRETGRYWSHPKVEHLFRDLDCGGQWVLIWKVPGRKSPKRKLLGHLPEPEAKALRDKYMGKPIHERQSSGRHTVASLKQAYWHDHTGTHIAENKRWDPTTLRKANEAWKNWISKHLPEHLKLSEIDAEAHMEAILADMRANLAPTTVLRNWAVVTGMFSYGFRRGWCDNVPQRIREELRPTAPPKEDKAVEIEEVIEEQGMKALLATFLSAERMKGSQYLNSYWWTIIVFAAKTGMRISEVVGFCRDQIVEIKGVKYICVDRQLRERFRANEPATWFTAVKNRKNVNGTFKKGNGRLIKLQPDVERMLHVHLLKKRWSSLPHPQGYVLVFSTYKGTPHYQSEIGRKFTAARDEAGYQGQPWTMHSLRHTYASERFAKGADYAKVAEELGDTIQVTMDTYVHLHDRVARDDLATEQYNQSFLSRLAL